MSKKLIEEKEKRLLNLKNDSIDNSKEDIFWRNVIITGTIVFIIVFVIVVIIKFLKKKPAPPISINELEEFKLSMKTSIFD